MDSRKEPRIPVEGDVKVTLLGNVEASFPGRAMNLSGKGMRLEIGRPLAPGSPVKVEAGDTLMLGEVMYCQAQAQGFAIGVALEQALYDVADLARLAARLLGPIPATRLSSEEPSRAGRRAGERIPEE